ncbi:hypothetical protein C8R46DRAFT_88833 [Mycena filopes]|nr:hypothetical protein C8R46DRAFT_88833 [Mycena filopes]
MILRWRPVQSGVKRTLPGLSRRFSTLDPARLKPSDYVDLSSSPYYVTHGDVKRAYYYLSYLLIQRAPIPFPPRTSGFFYYHRPDRLPLAASGIRFRLASVSPRSFIHGRDLLLPDGTPWEVPLRAMSASHRASHLKTLLVRDGLITTEQLLQSAVLFPRGIDRGDRKVLHRFDQPFSVKFHQSNYIQVLCGGERHQTDVRVFHEQRQEKLHPYAGSALVRFELVEPRSVALRVVKMIHPPRLQIPDYDGHLPAPVEGELIRRRKRGPAGELAPWTRKLDSKLGKPLALLLEAQPETAFSSAGR